MDLIVLDTTDSTNSHLQRLLDQGKAEEGTVVLSASQTAGRGQRGRTWESPPGQGLYASILLTPVGIEAHQQFQLNKAIAVAVALYVRSRVHCRTEVKWPNDILAEEKKVAGILIENAIRGRHISSCIAGVGINLNQPSFTGMYDTTPVSLRQLTGQFYDPRQETISLFDQIMDVYSRLKREGPDAMDMIYNPLLYRRNKTGLFRRTSGFFSGVLSEVDEDGAAIIEVDGKRCRHFHPETRQVVEVQE